MAVQIDKNGNIIRSGGSSGSTPSRPTPAPAPVYRPPTPSSSYSSGPDASDVMSVINGIVLGIIGGILIGLILAGGFKWNGFLSVIIGIGAAVGIFFLIKYVFYEEHPIITTIVSAAAVIITIIFFVSINNPKKTDKPEVTQTEQIQIIAIGEVSGIGALNLRAGPSTDYDVVRSLPEGTIVNIKGEAVDGFWPVLVIYNYDDGTSDRYEGYVGSSYIKIRE